MRRKLQFMKIEYEKEVSIPENRIWEGSQNLKKNDE